MGISKSEILLAELNTFFQRIKPKNIFSSIHAYYKTYENYKDVLLNIIRGKYPFQAKLRDGRAVNISNHIMAYFYTVYFTKLHIIRLDDNILEFVFNNRNVIFYEWNKGDVESAFAFHDYDFLDVMNKIVVDIGGSIADTAIYFALKGAKKVIVFEPFPKIFNIAQRNIKVNRLEDKIILVNAGCGYDEEVRIREDVESNAGTPLIDFGEGVKIPVYSLNTIVSKFNIERGSVLKVDCEGCEYDLIRNANKETLNRFEKIQIEYHYGYKELVSILKENGFKTKITIPRITPRGMIIGYVYAWKL